MPRLWRYIGWLWRYVQRAKNREVLAWCGGGVAALAVGGWAVFVYFFPAERSKPTAASTTTVTQAGTGIASARDTVISAPVV